MQPKPRGPPPMVSVILPVRNRATLVAAAARCVLDQTWKDLELILVDGGSTDGTVEVLRGLEASDGRVRLLLNGKAEGVAAARNAGARLARGRWLAFQDSDDAWHPQKLELQMEALRKKPAARIAYTGARRHFPGGTRLTPPDWDGPVDGDLHERLLRGAFMPTPTLVVERDLFLEVGGFDERLSFHEDWDLAVRCSAVSPLACVPDWLVDSPQMPDSLTRDIGSLHRALELLVDKHAPFLALRPALQEYRLARLGWSHLAGRRSRGWRYLGRALRVRPASLHGPTVRAARDIWTALRWSRPGKPAPSSGGEPR